MQQNFQAQHRFCVRVQHFGYTVYDGDSPFHNCHMTRTYYLKNNFDILKVTSIVVHSRYHSLSASSIKRRDRHLVKSHASEQNNSLNENVKTSTSGPLMSSYDSLECALLDSNGYTGGVVRGSRVKYSDPFDLSLRR
jgi:hypothetical protein